MIICPKCKGRVEIVDTEKVESPTGKGKMFIPIYQCLKCKKAFTDGDAKKTPAES